MFKLILFFIILFKISNVHALDSDKKLHVITSAGLAMAVVSARPDWTPTQQWTMAMALGAVKEISDSRESNNKFDLGDLMANGVGALIGIRLGKWAVTPNTIVYTTSF